MNIKKSNLTKILTKPITVGPNSTLVKVRESLLKNKVKRVVVVDKKKPIAVITEKDIAKKIYELGSKPIKSVLAKNFKPKKLFTLTRKNTVKECAKMMKKHRISVVIILNEDKTLGGIVTKTDLVKIFLTKGSESLKVSQVMKKKNLVTASPSDPILHIESLLLKYGISRVIIKRNQKPVGIITFRDFVPAKIPQWIAESADPKEVQEYKFKKGLEEHVNQMSYLFPFHATDIMASKPITIEADKEIRAAITLMIKHDISGLPVVKNSKLVGIITKSDIVSVLAS
ncbi:Inosine-5'-monophosphate dehydrogenase protein [Marine Group I thaumarchaeote SCGC AAA799-P11]|uniref:Inosine-5'-monophosphate dehydrogenase protein n=1 Tax=Marine Group I thaumarchaeote SCGC AAA799-P11 TaxID=1502295 RepID=A0A087S227_9ARCH|nr:Inosine-5'-monophosphate dehydrogenase protein [Marine Group I thaumarchaeote SCGC AAA799-P11]